MSSFAPPVRVSIRVHSLPPSVIASSSRRFPPSLLALKIVVAVVMLVSCVIPSATPLALQPRSTSRRFFLLTSFVKAPIVGILGSGVLAPLPSLAEATTSSTPIYKAWSAGDGFLDSSFISFSLESYKSMVDDKARTPAFKKAIIERLASNPPRTQVVMDLGTGPYAVLALQAARAGAKKVYAVEAIPQAAELARAAVRKAKDIPEGTIEVIEGLSTKITLPEKVDLVVAEIIGSIASEEGLHATLRDVHERHVKDPKSEKSFIPVKVSSSEEQSGELRTPTSFLTPSIQPHM